MARKFKSAGALILLLVFVLAGCSAADRNAITAETFVEQLRDFAVKEDGIPVIPETPENSTDTLKHYVIARGLDLTLAVSKGAALDEVALVCQFPGADGVVYANGYYIGGLLKLLTDGQSDLEYVHKQLDFDHPWTGYEFERTCECDGTDYSFSFKNNTWTFVIDLE